MAKRICILGCAVLVMVTAFCNGFLHAQVVPRGDTNLGRRFGQYSPEELVSFDSSLPMKTALEILSQYTSRHEGRIIIDPEGHSRPISVMVNRMYWKRALEYILRSNLLEYIEHDNYYEIVPLGTVSGEEEFIDIRSREIEINAIFFEADYQTLVEAGIDWTAINGGRVAVRGNFGGEVTKDLFRAGYVDRFGNWDVTALLRTFESLDKGEVIANPQIKVLEGEVGKIKVGVNFFLTTRDFAGNTRFTEYESGIILTVTPTIIGEADSMFIHLDIRAERSTVNPDAINVTKTITESSTQVLLLDGEEVAIAGLFSNTVTTSRRGIPILKDLPPWFFGLRYLFGYSSKQVTKKELIILLRATIIPTIAARLASKARRRNVLQEKLLEWKRRLRDLKSTNGRVPRRTRNGK